MRSFATQIEARNAKPVIGPVIAAVVTCALLALVKLKAPYQMLLADRFLPGAGWIEILLLGMYAAFIVRSCIASPDTSRIRLTIWLTFSIVFFTQFVLGIAGIDQFLMTGTLHVPVPAVVIAGPIFRGQRFFMPILFLSTIVLVGPAWCSYLCYFGPWDGLAASRRKRAGNIRDVWKTIRISLLILTPVSAVVLRVAGVAPVNAALIAVGFGVAGLGISASVSTRRGTMVHCTSICPLGMIGNILGKLSPFRIRIGAGCTECGRCTPACRYNALTIQRIEKRNPGYTCTLCGDCLRACPESAISYRFFRLSSKTARTVFIIAVVSLHAVFLGVARI